jgi:hypothetical protein
MHHEDLTATATARLSSNPWFLCVILPPVTGASAGSVVAVSIRCSLPPLEVLNALNSIAQVRWTSLSK